MKTSTNFSELVLLRSQDRSDFQHVAVSVENLSHAYSVAASRRRQYSGSVSDHTVTDQHTIESPRNHAVHDLAFDIEPGEIFGILGPNGSGKTTLFRILSTLLKPTCGRAFVFGYDVQIQPHEVRRQLGVVFQMPSLDVKLTATENLIHQGHLYGMYGRTLRHRIDCLLAHAGLAGKTNAYVETYSGGMRRQVELAKALLHTPRLLLLDEPSMGLDVGARRDMWEHLNQLCHDQGITIVLTTHLMDEADRCDRLLILAEGHRVALDTPENLKSQINGDVITIEPTSGQTRQLQEEITKRFGPWGQTDAPIVVDHFVRFERHNGPAFMATLAEALPGKIVSMTVGQPTLEDVFMRLTGRLL